MKLVGKVFGRLTVVAGAGVNKQRHSLWKCWCECGTESVVRGGHLNSGDTTSCGCKSNAWVKTHGLYADGTGPGDYAHSLYPTWVQMMARCLNPNAPNYAGYGGRGITIWNPFRYFRRWLEYIDEALGPRPDKHTLDRIDVNSHYAPGNLKWSDRKEQRRNQRRVANALADRIRDAAIADCTGTVEE